MALFISTYRIFRTLAAVLCGLMLVTNFDVYAQQSDGNRSTSKITAAELENAFNNVVRPYLASYCLDCHASEEPEAMLDLSGYQSANDVGQAHQTWAIVLERIEAGEMPPADATQPRDEEQAAVIDWIRDTREFEALRNAGDPGTVLVRRLSNAETNYTIRDLTGVDIRPTDSFPVDAANEAGFDNTGESLTMSPALLNKYLAGARQVVEHLMLLPEGFVFAPHPVVTDTDRDKYCVKRIVDFYQRQPVNLTDYFFAAWQYECQVRSADAAQDSLDEVARGHQISPKYLRSVWELLTDDENAFGPVAKLQAMWPARVDMQTDAARAQCATMHDYVMSVRPQLSPPIDKSGIKEIHTGSQTLVLWRNRQRAANRRAFDPSILEETAKVGDESIPMDPQQRAAYMAAVARFCDVIPDEFFVSERGRDYVDEDNKQQGEKGRLLSAGFHSMMGYFRDDGPLYDLVLDAKQQHEIDTLWQQLDFVTSAPMRQYEGFLWFERTDSGYMRDAIFDFARPEDQQAQSAAMIEKLAEVYVQKARENGGEGAAVEAVEQYFRDINTQIRWVEKARHDAQRSHLQAAIDFAERAYRRPLTALERADIEEFYQALRKIVSHEEAIQDVIVSVLMSPHFCYRVDMAPASEPLRPLTDFELASRLSYFLWSSMPDAELLAVARAGTLHQPDVLVAQTRRMLQDNRVRGLATEFGGNWLDFRRFDEHNSVDRERFPEFDDELRQAMFEEPIRFLMDLVRRDQSVLSLLEAKHTFVNAPLAKHYSLLELEFDNHDWLRVDDARDVGRGGLLPMSVFMTKNAPGLRTSPVKRGYWVVRRLLGERIPPPPPNVPELPSDESKLGELTLRETLARHREHASCAGCHERIDSIGLVFESYGPVGEVRQFDLGGRPVDATALLPDGRQAVGLDDLRKYLSDERGDEFVENLIRKLLSYALGRGLILSDELLVRDIHSKLTSEGNRFSVIVECIVTSPQFLNKKIAMNGQPK
ncbi:MAG: DUF1592 domain-containing protein [Pirellulaceae bacterium]